VARRGRRVAAKLGDAVWRSAVMTVDPHDGQLMAEHMTTAVVTLDASDHVLAMNPAAEALFRLNHRLARGWRLLAWLGDGGEPLAICLCRER